MNITSAQYYNDANDAQAGIRIVVDGITMDVPIQTSNRHYDEIMRQVEAGDLTIDDAD